MGFDDIPVIMGKHARGSQPGGFSWGRQTWVDKKLGTIGTQWRYVNERLVKLEAKLSISEPVAAVSPREKENGPLAETALMNRIRHGDREAFGQWVTATQDRLVNYLTRLCGQPELAEDLAQESFLRFYHALPKLSPKDLAPLAYLFRIAVNLLRSRERRQKRFAKIRTLFGLQDQVRMQAQHAARPNENMLRAEVAARVQAAISRLPLTYREPLILREVEGWSYREIAAHLRIREGTVKSRIARGKQHLKHQLHPYLKGAP